MEKINIAELLRDCPTGMELDCTICDNVCLDEVTPHMIKCFIKNNAYNTIYFNHDGTYLTAQNAKCVIFPKGKTTWEGFQRPFKDGDVVYIQSLYEYIAIYKKTNCKNLYKHAAICISFNNRLLSDNNILCCEEDVKKIRLATEEEKQKLFDAIKANGYKWNPETKTLEKLIEPKFKVGDRVRYKGDTTVITITGIKDDYYFIQFYNPKKNDYQTERFSFKDQDKYELVPNKFDFTTLKPFESRVLVRTNNRKWVAAFYSHYDKDSSLHHCVVGGLWYEQCVPYNGNEYLLNTTNNCDNYYKTWE